MKKFDIRKINIKKINIALAIVLIILLFIGGKFLFGAKLTATASSVHTPAEQNTDTFNNIVQTVSNYTAPLIFQENISDDPSAYTIVESTITLTNNSSYKAEWLDITVTPADGDIAVYSISGKGIDVHAHESAQLEVKLLTSDDAAIRDVTITYYIRGSMRKITMAI